VLIDALCQISGTSESYTSQVPEPFTYIPEDQRSIAIADGSITSPFLEMFGRPPRDTGLESERSNRPTSDQRLHLLNSTHIRRKLERAMPRLMQNASKNRPRVAVENLYLAILSRYPTDEELAAVGEYVRPARSNPRDGMMDVAWALVNSAEFLYRH
jgi:hypothetical protein